MEERNVFKIPKESNALFKATIRKLRTAGEGGCQVCELLYACFTNFRQDWVTDDEAAMEASIHRPSGSWNVCRRS